MRPPSPAIRRNLVAGALAGLCGGLAFALAHAILIVPIWNRSAGGLLAGALAGAIAGWAYTDVGFDPTTRAGGDRGVGAHAAAGALLGALLWLAVVPVTVVDAALRTLGVLPRYELLGVAVAVLLAVGAGALLGWRRGRTRRAAIAGAAAALMLTIAMGGPVPVGHSRRALGIFLAVLPAAVTGGAVLGVLAWSFRAAGASDGEQRRSVTAQP